MRIGGVHFLCCIPGRVKFFWTTENVSYPPFGQSENVSYPLSRKPEMFRSPRIFPICPKVPCPFYSRDFLEMFRTPYCFKDFLNTDKVFFHFGLAKYELRQNLNQNLPYFRSLGTIHLIILRLSSQWFPEYSPINCSHVK